MTSDLGRHLRDAAAARGLTGMVIGFASDYIGYCIPETLYDSEEYEATLAFNGPCAGRLVVERLTRLVEASAP